MRVFAVLSLPPETFLPHTSQRTVLLLAKKRPPSTRAERSERIFFAVSERAGTDTAGEPVSRPNAPLAGSRASWRDRDHDLGSLARPLQSFLARAGFAGGIPNGAEGEVP